MKKYILTVEALSPVHLGAGKSDVIIDAETAHDEFGMPYFPAKRLKGLLYESALELAEMSNESSFTIAELKHLFGQDEKGIAAFNLGNLYLPDYLARRDGWEYLFKEYEGLFNKNNVLENYTELRFQTKIDPKKGTAMDGSLHNIRLVNSGTKFTAELELLEDTAQNEKILELACLNLRYAGAKRNRGCGHVRLTLTLGGEA